jgi:predicted XRE-type DNA-binding protein
MAFPSEKELEKMRKKLDKVSGTLMLSSNPTSIEKLRWEICQEFVKYANRKDLKNIELAKILGVHESEVSKILHHRIEKMTTDKLLQLLTKIQPNHQVSLKVS